MLAQHRTIHDSETGGAYTVKYYRRITPLADDQERNRVTIHLVSENPDFKPIVIETTPEDPITIIAEFVEIL